MFYQSLIVIQEIFNARNCDAQKKIYGRFSWNVKKRFWIATIHLSSSMEIQRWVQSMQIIIAFFAVVNYTIINTYRYKYFMSLAHLLHGDAISYTWLLLKFRQFDNSLIENRLSWMNAEEYNQVKTLKSSNILTEHKKSCWRYNFNFKNLFAVLNVWYL